MYILLRGLQLRAMNDSTVKSGNADKHRVKLGDSDGFDNGCTRREFVAPMFVW